MDESAQAVLGHVDYRRSLEIEHALTALGQDMDIRHHLCFIVSVGKKGGQ